MYRRYAAACGALLTALGATGCGSDDPDREPGAGGGIVATDSHGEYHQLCIDKINELRATKGLPAYARWTEIENCVDGQSSSDEESGSAHGAFGQCGESSQNECLGSGMTGIEGCLDSMWGEKNQAACSGCDACADGYDPSCPSCDYYGAPCGHYVNMSAQYYTRAACGFSSLGGWATIDFQ
jgi:hypothetical protein